MRASLVFLVGCARAAQPALFADELAEQSKNTGLREPVPVIAVVGDAYWPSPSPDGTFITFTSVVNGNTDVWKKDIVTGDLVKLTTHSADNEDPAVSPDGKKIAFISHRDDVKGDIYLMNPNGGDEEKITDSSASERAPAWAPDGKSIFVSSRPKPDALEDVYRVDLETKKRTKVSSGGGFDSSVHKSGDYICYSQPVIASDGHTTSRIVAMRLSDRKVSPVSDGRRPEAFCRFSGDWVYFTRYVEDDNRDERFDTLDVPALYRVPFDPRVFEKDAKTIDISEPVTSGFAWETLAAPTDDRVYFVANGAAGLEIQVLPLEGLSPKSLPTKELLALAQQDIPPRMRRYFFRVVMARGGPEALTARYELSRDFAAENRLEDSQAQFTSLLERAGSSPLAVLARIEQARNQFFIDFREQREDALDLEALRKKIDVKEPPIAVARAKVVMAEAAELVGNYTQSLEYARQVPKPGNDMPEDSARSMRVDAVVGALALSEDEQQRRLLALMRARPEQTREVREAKTRFLQLLPEEPHARLSRLREMMPLCKDQKALYVQLALAEAEALVAIGQASLAISELAGQRDDKALAAVDRGRVLFALGKTQEAAGELDAALKSYDTLARSTQFNRVQRARGRAELLRLALKKARAEEATGDTRSAYESYRTLASNNAQEAFAHRKVLQLGDALGLTPQLEKEYTEKAKLAPYDATAQYAGALAATYVGDLSRAKKGFETAIALDSSFAYAHIGLGWVLEQYEYRSPETSDALEQALNEYGIARSLFEKQRDPDSVAEAAMNLGHAYAGIGKFDRAFEQYLLRDASRAPFQSKAQEILFHERFGQAAIRNDEPDVALMTLKEGIKIAEREGDERRLGRMRALLALAYDALRMRGEARDALTKARDEYATRGDWNRVVALDRTLGYMWLETGDERAALEALDRALAKMAQGYGPEGKSRGLTLYLASVAGDSSRAPYGFSKDDEAEILQMLLGRVHSRIGDTVASRNYLEERLKRTEAQLGGSLGKFMLPELFAASRELMELSLRRHDYVRAAELYVDIGPRYHKAEERFTDWMLGPTRMLRRMPFPLLPPELLAQVLQQLDALVSASSEKVTGDVERLRRLGKEMRDRADKLISEGDAWKNPASPEQVWASLPGVPAAPAQAASQPSSLPTETSRRSASRHVAVYLDRAEAAFLSGDLAAGESLLKEARPLIERFALYDVDWQIEYLRYRLGDPEKREQALDAAEKALATADALSRLLWPQRERPGVWGGLVNALQARALRKKDADAYARVLERKSGLQMFALPVGFARPEEGESERGRAALQAWANRGRDLIAKVDKELDPRDEKALVAHIAAGAELVNKAAEPWRSLLLCEIDGKRLRAAIGEGTVLKWDRVAFVGQTFTWDIPKQVHYAVGDAPAGAAHVSSANMLWLAASARNIDDEAPIELGPVTKRKTSDTGVPPEATTLDDGLARTDVIAAQSSHYRLARFVLSAELLEGAPGVARMRVSGDNTFETSLSTVQLPAIGLSANFAVVDDLASLDRALIDAVSRALILAGTPAALFCAPKDPQAHGAMLQKLYVGLRQQRSLDAWTAVATPDCEYWGFSNDDDKTRVAFAKARMLAAGDKIKNAVKEKRWAEVRDLYEMVYRYARFLNDAEKVLEALAGIASSSGSLEDYDRAIASQQLVLEAAKTPKQKGEALIILGLLRARSKQFESAARTLDEAATTLKPIALDRYAFAKSQEGTAWRNAARYREAARAYRHAFEAFTQLKALASQITALRTLGIVNESNLAELNDAKKIFDQTRTLASQWVIEQQKAVAAAGADAAKQKAAKDGLASAESARSLARIDFSRVARLLGEFDAALKELRGLLADLPATDFLRRAEATLEVARVFWYMSDYERALNTVSEAMALAEKGRATDERSSGFLRIQALSFEGVILKDQGKRVAASNRLRRALRLARVSNRRTEESVQLNNLGLVMRERGLYEQAVRLIGRAIAIDTDLKDKGGLTVDLRNLAYVRLRQGKHDQARDLLERAEKLNKEAGTRSNGLQIAIAQGELALQEKRLPDAVKAFELAIAEATALHSRDLEWRARFGLGLADPKRARAEQEKALAVIESLGPQREEQGGNLLGATKLRESVARMYVDAGDVTALWSLLERVRLKEIRDQVPSDVWSKRLSVAGDDATDFAKLDAAARARDEDGLVPLFSLKHVELAELQRARPNSKIVVLRAFDEGVVVLIGGEKPRYIPRKKAALLEALSAWDASLRALQPASKAAEPLFQIIAEALQPALTGAPLLILGDGTFNRLPWAAVPINGKRLIELARIDLDLSGTHAAMTAKKQSKASLIAVGPRGDDALPFARMETEDSVASFSEKGHSARAMTLAEFAASKDRAAQLWHVAVHGDSYGKELRGAFLHSGEDTTFYATELIEHRQSVQTAIVSACEKSGEEPNGVALVSALRLSGASRVLAPVSRVYDDLTAGFVKRLMRAFAEDPDGDPLRALQIDALRRGEPEAAWATFIQTGVL